MRPKKITDQEFRGWLYYLSSGSGFWIYYSPDNSEAAMVDPATFEVLFLTDRSNGEKLYQHPEIKKFSTTLRKLNSQLNPRIL